MEAFADEIELLLGSNWIGRRRSKCPPVPATGKLRGWRANSGLCGIFDDPPDCSEFQGHHSQYKILGFNLEFAKNVKESVGLWGPVMKRPEVVKVCGQELWDQQESFVYDK